MRCVVFAAVAGTLMFGTKVFFLHLLALIYNLFMVCRLYKDYRIGGFISLRGAKNSGPAHLQYLSSEAARGTCALCLLSYDLALLSPGRCFLSEHTRDRCLVSEHTRDRCFVSEDTRDRCLVSEDTRDRCLVSEDTPLFRLSYCTEFSSPQYFPPVTFGFYLPVYDASVLKFGLFFTSFWTKEA